MTELEKAASEYAKYTSDLTGEESTNVDDLTAFRAGDQWQTKQSPWKITADKPPCLQRSSFLF